MRAEIIEKMENNLFALNLETGRRIVAHLSQQLRMSSVRLLPGDLVDVILSDMDQNKGKIEKIIQ